MKRLIGAICVLGLGAVLAAPALGQGNPRGEANLTLNGAKISIDYGRPSLKGRSVQDLLGQLPAGQVWRMGADSSTTFTTSADLDFSGTAVVKGKYSLWARKGADGSWKLVFNSQHGQWGTDHDASKDAVSVPLTQAKGSAADEVTINLEKQGDGGVFSVQWGDLELSANFTAK